MSNRATAKAVLSGGYSLAELVIVMACITILIAAAVPNIVSLQNEWTLLSCTRILEASLQWGRIHAIASNMPMMFEVDKIQRKLHWADAVSGECYANTIRQLPGDVRIVAAPRRPLRFYPHGNAVPAGTYTLEGDAGSYSVIVAPGGRIRVQRN
jgi:Tfp pilus assembly protein FimT